MVGVNWSWQQMKQVDPTKFTIIKAGKAHTSEGAVNIKQIISIMERNESYIFWLQPKGASVQAQFPCIQINGIFYQLNLRLEKVIFRHVRLTRDFVNLELLEDGTPKLRIPSRLHREKLRTALRSEVCFLFF